MARLSDAHAIYGIQKVKVAANPDRLMVEYDATRMRPAEVEAALTRAGIAIEPRTDERTVAASFRLAQ